VLLQMRALVEMEGSGLVPLLQGDKYQDLARMYSLFRHARALPASCIFMLTLCVSCGACEPLLSHDSS
jgi:hypothetical protein